MKYSRFAFVDVETTGLSAYKDAIMDIGIICVDDGIITKTYNKLINPKQSIQPYIKRMTGITEDMLQDAPVFETVSNDIEAMLTDRIFVAHNATFDYGFIKAALEEVNLSLHEKMLCTVKLSKQLFPYYDKHSLDQIIHRFGIACENRHRAYADAYVLYEFYTKLLERYGRAVVEKAITYLLKNQALPVHIEKEILRDLPSTPGVYAMYGEDNALLYIGKSVNIKKRVSSHFTPSSKQGADTVLVSQVRHISYHKTPGELSALMTESKMIKEQQPLLNHKLKKNDEHIVIYASTNQTSYIQYKMTSVPLYQIEMGRIIKIAKSKQEAKSFLEKIRSEFQLCPKLLGLDNKKGACFYYSLHSCFGACVGKERIEEYNQRVMSASEVYGLVQWPFVGPIAITESCDSQYETYICEDWQITGIYHVIDDQGYYELVSPHPFDYDEYTIIKEYVIKHPKKIKINPDLNEILGRNEHIYTQAAQEILA